MNPNFQLVQWMNVDYLDQQSGQQGDGDGSWPMSGYTYLILHQTSMTDCIKARNLLEYFRWTITDASASARAAKPGYAVLPDAVLNQVFAEPGEVTCNGQPVMK